jgi:hypothetical protein
MKNKKILSRNGLYTLALVLLAIGLWTGFGFLIPSVQAQAGGAGMTVQGNLGGDLEYWLSKISAINTFMHILLLIALDFAGYFLQSDFFTNAKMMQALNTIWQLSRDIMNLIFALMLVGVAIYTIITAKSDLIKGKIAQFIIAVILVNFSWFFPRVILDISSVLTATIYNIPKMLPGWDCMALGDDGLTPVPCKVIVAKKLFGSENEQSTWKTNNGCLAGPDPNCPCYQNVGCYKLVDYNAAQNQMVTSNLMLNGLAVSFARLTSLAKVPESIIVTAGAGVSPQQAVWTSFQTLMNVLITFIIQLCLVLPLIAMAVGFMIRLLIIWITTALMPFTFLGVVINGKPGTNVFGFETNIWSEFLVAAFLPAMVALPIVIGIIFLTASVQTAPPDLVSNTDWSIPLINGVKNWWAMLWMLGAVMIIWMGSFAALSKSKYVGAVTGRIKAFGDSIAKGAMQLPLLAPIPLPGGGKASLGQAWYGAQALPSSLKTLSMQSPTERKGLLDTIRGNLGATQSSSVAINLRDETKLRNLTNELTRLKTAEGAQRDTHIRAIQTQMGVGNLSNIDTLKLLHEATGNGNATAQLQNLRADISGELLKEQAKAKPPGK